MYQQLFQPEMRERVQLALGVFCNKQHASSLGAVLVKHSDQYSGTICTRHYLGKCLVSEVCCLCLRDILEYHFWCRGQVLQTGLLDGTALTNIPGSSTQSIDLLKPARDLSIPGSASSASAQLNESRRSEQMAPTGKADAALEAENERLKQQLLTAQELASQWQNLHRDLHKFCVDKVIATTQA